MRLVAGIPSPASALHKPAHSRGLGPAGRVVALLYIQRRIMTMPFESRRFLCVAKVGKTGKTVKFGCADGGVFHDARR